jgi:hypothetical protein
MADRRGRTRSHGGMAPNESAGSMIWRRPRVFRGREQMGKREDVRGSSSNGVLSQCPQNNTTIGYVSFKMVHV